MAYWGLKEFSQDEYTFRIYDNVGKKKHATIMKETGCCDIINLAYFDMTSRDLDHESNIMIGGKWMFGPKYHEWGICIDKAGKLTLGTEKDATYDYAVGLRPTVINGLDYSYQSTADMNGVTYVGIKANGNVILYVSTREWARTTAQATATMREVGCIHILRYDGSWSSAGHVGHDVTPSQYRVVRSHLLVFRKPSTGGDTDNVGAVDGEGADSGTVTPPTDGGLNMNNIQITQKITTKGANYVRRASVKNKKEMMIHSTAIPGGMVNTIYNVFNNPTREAGVEYVIDDTGIYQFLPNGIDSWHSGNRITNQTYSAVEICEPMETCMIPINWVVPYRGNSANRPYAVKRLQQELLARGFDPKGVDGSFGTGCEAAMKAYQKANGLTVDGTCNRATLNLMAKRKGSYMAYNPANAEPYFTKVYNNAVQLTAYRIKADGGSVDKVLCHSEGYRKGIASNHADVMHWFPYHGKDMDIFRADVKKVLAGGNSSTPATAPVSAEYLAALSKMAAKGFIGADVVELLKGGSFTTDMVQTIVRAAATRLPMHYGPAIDILVAEGIINSGDYWKGTTYSNANAQLLIMKLADKI